MKTTKNYMDIYDLKAFKDGISTLPPGKEFRTLLDFGPPRFEEKLPDVYRVTIRYRGDPGDRAYEEEMDLDFGLYWNRRSITLHDIHDVHKPLRAIAKEMKRWRPGIGSGLLGVTPEDVNERHEDAEKQMEEHRAEQAKREKKPSEEEPG